MPAYWIGYWVALMAALLTGAAATESAGSIVGHCSALCRSVNQPQQQQGSGSLVARDRVHRFRCNLNPKLRGSSCTHHLKISVNYKAVTEKVAEPKERGGSLVHAESWVTWV